MVNAMPECTDFVTKIIAASAATSILLYPFDSILKKIQLEGFLGNNRNVLGSMGIIKQIFAERSFVQLYRGLPFLFAKSCLLSGFQFGLKKQYEMR